MKARYYLSLFLYLSTYYQAQAGPSNLDQQFIRLIPEGQLKLEHLVDLGYRFSDQVQLLKTEKASADVSIVRAQQSTDGSVSSSFSQSRNWNDPGGSGARTRDARALNMSYQKSYLTGTTLSSSLSSSWSDVNITPTNIDIKGYETKIELSLKQSLLRNSLGESFESSRQAARRQGEALEEQYKSGLEDWFLQLQQIYSQAYLAQRNVSFADERVKNQRHLLKVSRLMYRRGTADEADVLNVEQALTRIKQQQVVAIKNLKDVWRQLVILLKLPEMFLQVNPENIPMAIDAMFDESNRLCTSKALEKALDSQRPQFAAIHKSIAAQQATKSATESMMKPDLYVSATMGGNGRDEDYGASLTDALRLSNPHYALVFGFDMNIGDSSRSADLKSQMLEISKLKIQLSSLKASERIAWNQSCAKLKQVRESMTMARKSIELNRKRARLEEERFGLGKVEAQTVIAALNDLSSAGENLSSLEREWVDAIWGLKRQLGEVPAYIENSVKNSSLKAIKP